MRSVMLSAASILACARDRAAGLRRRQEVEADILQRAPSGARGVRADRAPGVIHAPIGLRKRGAEPLADRRAQALRAAKIASGSTSRPISRAMSASLGGVSVSATKAGSSSVSARIAAERRHQPFILARRRALAQRRDVVGQERHRQRLHRLPAVERIGIVRREEAQIVGLDRERQLDRRREAAIEREDRPLRDAGEDEALARLRQRQHAALERASVERQRQVAAVACRRARPRAGSPSAP